MTILASRRVAQRTAEVDETTPVGQKQIALLTKAGWSIVSQTAPAPVERPKPETWDDLSVVELKKLLKAAAVTYGSANKVGLVDLAVQHLGESLTDEHLASLDEDD